MDLLVLGGTQFAGRHVVDGALARGWRVTTFTRGVTVAQDPRPLRAIHGDRDRDLDRLPDERWDAVVDTSAYLPRTIAAATEALAGRVGRYLFVSSISAYERLDPAGTTEDAPLARLADGQPEELTSETYGPLKAACEAVVERACGERALILRPGLLIGPEDPTERFTYWVRRARRPGPLLAPGDPRQPMQVLDARDLAIFALDLIEAGETGAFNAVGPVGGTLTLGDVVDACIAGVADAGPVTWVGEDLLLAHGATPFEELPLWLPASQSEYAGFCRVDAGRARRAGLRTRPLSETIADTAAWAAAHPPAEPSDGLGGPAPGLAPEREAALLRAWAAAADPPLERPRVN